MLAFHISQLNSETLSRNLNIFSRFFKHLVLASNYFPSVRHFPLCQSHINPWYLWFFVSFSISCSFLIPLQFQSLSAFPSHFLVSSFRGIWPVPFRVNFDFLNFMSFSIFSLLFLFLSLLFLFISFFYISTPISSSTIHL